MKNRYKNIISFSKTQIQHSGNTVNRSISTNVRTNVASAIRLSRILLSHSWTFIRFFINTMKESINIL